MTKRTTTTDFTVSKLQLAKNTDVPKIYEFIISSNKDKKIFKEKMELLISLAQEKVS